MAMLPSWEYLSDAIDDMRHRLRDLETARRVFSTRSLTTASTIELDSPEEYNTWLGTSDGSSVGPDLPSVQVYSGSMLVVVTAGITVSGGIASADAFMSYALLGPTEVSASTDRALIANWTPDGPPGKTTASYAFMHTGLTPGQYNIYSRYRVNTTGTPASIATFKNRHILAVPF